METAQGRRKHGACVLRVRETCPLRRLRKNRCYDVQKPPSAGVPCEHWAPFDGHPALSPVHVAADVAAASAEARAQAARAAAVRPSAPQLHLLEEHYAMDVGSVRSHCPSDLPSTRSTALPHPLCTDFQSSPPHLGLSVLHCGTSMELDNAVDPETGEKAQG